MVLLKVAITRWVSQSKNSGILVHGIQQLDISVKVTSTVTESKSHRPPLGCGVYFYSVNTRPKSKRVIELDFNEEEGQSKKCIL